MKVRFYKMVDFPVSPLVGEEFPKLTETKPGQFSAKYHYWTDRVEGWLMGNTANGSGKRRYPFRVELRNGMYYPKVSTADSDNKNFDDRDGIGKPIRELKWMPRKHRPDLHDYAKRIAEHVRERVFEEEGWLIEQFASSAPIEIDAKLQKHMRFAFLRGWLLAEEARVPKVRAYFLGQAATSSIAQRAAESFVANNGRGDWWKP